MTPTETRVSTICAEVLGLEHVELDDDLYELGSDSHQAVLVALEIESVFQVSLPLEVLETTANVRALATWIDDQLVAGREGRAGVQAGPGVDG